MAKNEFYYVQAMSQHRRKKSNSEEWETLNYDFQKTIVVAEDRKEAISKIYEIAKQSSWSTPKEELRYVFREEDVKKAIGLTVFRSNNSTLFVPIEDIETKEN